MATITDATTTLDTAWTEKDKSIPQFAAGVLLNIDSCVTEVEAKLKRGTLGASTAPTTTQVKNWIKRGKLKLAQVRDFSFTQKYAYATLSTGAYQIQLPPDFQGGECIVKDITNDYALRNWPKEWFFKEFPDPSAESNGYPAIFSLHAGRMWISPPASSDVTIELLYHRSGAETTVEDMSWLPEYERFLVCDFAVGMSFESLHMWGEADRFLGRWNEELGYSIKAEGRRKWKKGQFKAIDVFQEFNARNYQWRKK